MAIPKQVEEAGKKAEALSKELNEGPAPGQQPPADPGQPPANPEQPPQDGQQPNQPVQPGQNPQDAQPQNVQQPGQQQEDWQQKYASLQGMYNSQVPKLQQDVAKLQQMVTELQNENKQLREAATPNNQPDPNGNSEISSLSREALAEYGDEFGSMADFVNHLAAQNKTLQQKLDTLSNDVNQSQKNFEANTYNNYLAEVKKGIANLGGNFDVLNTDQNFLNWLRQYPHGEAESRFAKLKRAEEAIDYDATMAVWSEYLNPTPAQPPGQPPNNQQQNQQYQQPGQQQPNVPPNLQPAPTQTGVDINPPQQQQMRTWTRAQIKQFYADKTAGKYRGREEESKAIEADLMAAPQQGRVIG